VLILILMVDFIIGFGSSPQLDFFFAKPGDREGIKEKQ